MNKVKNFFYGLFVILIFIVLQFPILSIYNIYFRSEKYDQQEIEQLFSNIGELKKTFPDSVKDNFSTSNINYRSYSFSIYDSLVNHLDLDDLNTVDKLDILFAGFADLYSFEYTYEPSLIFSGWLDSSYNSNNLNFN